MPATDYRSNPLAMEGRPTAPPRRLALDRALLGLVRAAEWGFAVVGLLVYSGAILPLLQEGGAGSAEGGLAQGVFWTVYLGTGAVCLARPLAVARTALHHKPTLALLGLALVSLAWSIAPEETLRFGFRVTMATLFGVYLASRFSLGELLRVLACALGLVAVLSVAAALLAPAYGISGPPHPGAWRGVFPHKNTLGMVMSLGAGVFALLGTSAARGRWLAWSGFALAVALILLSRSTSAMVVLVTALGLLPVLRMLPRHPGRLLLVGVSALLLAAGTAVVVIAGAETVFAVLGKDATLTGRTDLWAAILASVAERPLLGHGYYAFWRDPSVAGMIWNRVAWEMTDSHNGYLELTLHLGVVGLTIFLVGLGVAVRRSLEVLWASRSSEGLWPLMFLAVLLLQNLTESTLLFPAGTWVIYVAVACGVGARAASLRASPAPARVRPPRVGVRA